MPLSSNHLLCYNHLGSSEHLKIDPTDKIMETLLIFLSITLVVGGIIFSVVPPLPGPLITYAAVWSTHYVSSETSFSTTSLIGWGILAGLMVVLDNVLPLLATKKFGGTKAGLIGGTLGGILGLLLPIPLGIVIGPLVGAILGDLYGGNHLRSAFKSGLGSFAGFLAAMIIKVIFSLVLGGVIVWKLGAFTISLF